MFIEKSEVMLLCRFTISVLASVAPVVQGCIQDLFLYSKPLTKHHSVRIVKAPDPGQK